MTTARHLLVSSTDAAFYHCVSRCVRRAWLCGEDPVSGRSFAHRRQWIEDRLLALADSFSVGIYAYAVMSNHVHVVLRVDPAVANAWSDDEVAARWMRLFPSRNADATTAMLRRLHLTSNGARIAVCRQRLADLSWFMRCLNEPIARRANDEDDCTGRFWEGRYKCQALLDDTAVLAAMTYVDLNPLRAGMVESLGASDHTTIQRRLSAISDDTSKSPLTAVAGVEHPLEPTQHEYVALVDFTGRQWRPGKRGTITGNPPAVLSSINLAPDRWVLHVRGVGSGYWRAVGSATALLDRAASMGQRWLKGIGVARNLARSTT